MSNRYFLYIRIFFTIFVSLFSTLSFASATGSITIERGTPATVSWTVTGGGGSCTGAWDTGSIGTIGASTYNYWDGSVRPTTGSHIFNSANGDAFVIAGGPFILRCTDGANSDTVSVTVEDCGGALSPGRTFWDGSACVAPAVNGVCNATAYNCDAGSSGSNSAISNGYTWMCNGSGGGGNASCNQCINGTAWDGDSCELTPVNGVCSGTTYTCTTGSLRSGNYLSNGTYYWYCDGSNGGSNSGQCTSACSATAATINSIAWTPASVASNGSSDVSWSTSNADSCTVWSTLSGGEVSTALNNGGSTYANRVSNDTWSISCKNSCDVRSATSSATLTVGPADNAPTGSGTIVQCGLASGSASDSDSPATQLTIAISIDGGAEQTTVTSGGNFSYQTSSVSAGVHSYIIRARGVDTGGTGNGNNPQIASGNFTCTTPTVDLQANGANSLTITSPTNTATLSWSTTNLNVTGSTCTASNGSGLAWTGGKATTTGSESSPTMTIGAHTYTLTCSKPGLSGTYADSVVVTMNGAALVNPTVTATPATISDGGNTNLIFSNTSGANLCALYRDTTFITTQSGGGIGATVNSGALSTGSYTYKYGCRNVDNVWGATSTDLVTVDTILVNPTITASSPNISSGGNSAITFGSTAGATQCDLYKDSGSGNVFVLSQPANYAIGAATNTGMLTVGTYTYQYTCKNSDGFWGSAPTAVVTVAAASTVNPTITASSPVIQSGGNSNLIFGNTSGATQCDLYKNAVFYRTQPANFAIGAATNTGALPSGLYTFMYTCKNGDGVWGTEPEATVQAVTDAVCAPTHYSCTTGNSTNNLVAAPGWTWDCNSTDGGASDSCSELGYNITTSIYYRPGATGSISPLGVTPVVSGGSQTVTITPTGSSMIYARTIDGVTETVSGVAPVSTANIDFINVTENHIASTTLYIPAPITVTVTEVSGIADTQYLGDNITINWTTTGDRCNVYDFTGAALIKTVGIVNPLAASTVLAAAPSDLPSTVGKFGYVIRCTDSQDINRGSGEDATSIVLSCPRDPLSYRYTVYPATPVSDLEYSQCTNPAPVVNLDLGNQTIVLGQSVTYTSTANDATGDIEANQFEWMTPSGTYSWQPIPQGSVTYDVADTFPGSPSGAHVIQATFTPTLEGTYRVRSVVKDDYLNNSLIGYFTGPTGRLTYSQSNFNNAPRVTVTRRAGATILPIDTDTFRWTCYNTDFMSLQRFDGAATSTIIGYRSMPPVSGTFDAVSGTAYYSLLCESTIDKAVAVYFPPTLTLNSVAPTTSDLAWNCNAATAQSALIERSGGVGMIPISTSNTSTTTFVQSGLTSQTDYTYKLRCFDGPLVGNSVTGNQIGITTLDITTPSPIIDLNPIVIDANIKGKISDPATLTTATTTDGSFYDWTYTITSGTPTFCDMSQRNDDGSWYSNVPPGTDPSSYTLSWSSLLTAEKQAFVNSFMNKHDWKITCVSPLGTLTTKTWSLVKVRPSIPIIDSITEPVAGPILANVTLHCSPAATDYKIRNSANVIVQTGAGTSGVDSITWDPTVAGNYSITCDDGPIVVVYITPTMWDPVFRMTGSSKTLGNTSSVTLTWDISNPDATCRLWAEVTIPASGCSNPSACYTDRMTASSTINALISSANTDANDPYWPNGNGFRTVTEALQTPANNTPNARGKVTFTGLRYGTTFVGQCAGTPQIRVKVGVTTVNEG